MKNGWLCEDAPSTGDPITLAICALLASGSALFLLPKKRAF